MHLRTNSARSATALKSDHARPRLRAVLRNGPAADVRCGARKAAPAGAVVQMAVSAWCRTPFLSEDLGTVNQPATGNIEGWRLGTVTPCAKAFDPRLTECTVVATL
jgi:hypothetical protein